MRKELAEGKQEQFDRNMRIGERFSRSATALLTFRELGIWFSDAIAWPRLDQRLRHRDGRTESIRGAVTRPHRLRDVDQEQHLARAGAPFQPSEPQHFAIAPYALAQGAAQIRPRPAARAHAPVAAASRQPGRGFARQFS